MNAITRRDLMACSGLLGGAALGGCKLRAQDTYTAAAGGQLGAGGQPMSLPAIAALARRIGGGEPLALIDLAAVDHNCEILLDWSRQTGIAWRPAYKTLQAAGLLAYVVSKLDQPRVMIHHLRNLPDALQVLPADTDFMLGYPPTVGELAAYLQGAYAPLDAPHRLRINIDSLPLLEALLAQLDQSRRPRPLELVLELDSGGPRGGLQPGAELARLIERLLPVRRQVSIGGLLCYDVLAAADANAATRLLAAQTAQGQLDRARRQLQEQAAHLLPAGGLISNGPGSANYRNWTGSVAANEFSAGSAILFANYLDNYDDGSLRKAMYLCAPVLRLPERLLAGLPLDPADLGMQLTFIKAGGWPTGNNPTLSKLVYPAGLREAPPYGRGANSSGMLLSPPGSLALGDYVIETAQQVMEGQNYFGALVAVREERVLAHWASVPRWGGAMDRGGHEA